MLTKERFMMISSDCHASPMATTYRDYLEGRYLSELNAAVKQQEATIAADRAFAATKTKSLASQPVGQRFDQRFSRDYDQRRIYATDLSSRLDQIAEDGWVGELVFPDNSVGNSIPFTGAFFGDAGDADRDQYCAILRAYNRWLGETSTPDRQLGVALVPLHDPEYAVEQVKLARRLGLRGVMPQWDGFDPSFRPLYDPAFDAFWAACADEGLPVSFHSHVGLPKAAAAAAVGRHDAVHDAGRQQRAVAWAILGTEYLFWGRRPLWHLILGGVLERHPRLSVGFVEMYADWVPRTLDFLDFKWKVGKFDVKDLCPKLPSEYWRRQCWVGSHVTSVGEAQQFKECEYGIETVTYGTDFPHPNSPWGVTREALRASIGLAGVSENETRLILGENLARIYKVDVAKLVPIVERIGPLPEEILDVTEGEDVTIGLDDYLIANTRRRNTV